MTKRRLLSMAVSSALAIGCVTAYLPAEYEAPSAVMSAVAADYTTVKEGLITYNVYSDHAEVVQCTEEKDANGEIIPAGDVVLPSEMDLSRNVQSENTQNLG